MEAAEAVIITWRNPPRTTMAGVGPVGVRDPRHPLKTTGCYYGSKITNTGSPITRARDLIYSITIILRRSTNTAYRQLILQITSPILLSECATENLCALLFQSMTLRPLIRPWRPRRPRRPRPRLRPQDITGQLEIF